MPVHFCKVYGRSSMRIHRYTHMNLVRGPLLRERRHKKAPMAPRERALLTSPAEASKVGAMHTNHSTKSTIDSS